MLLDDIKTNETYEIIKYRVWIDKVRETGRLEPVFEQSTNDDERGQVIIRQLIINLKTC